MLFEDLERINKLLDSINEDKVIKPAKEDEVDKVDMEKELKSTGNKNKDFSEDIVNAINDIINGEGTIEELIEIVKGKKK